MKKLENKTVFITGGLSGIGMACAIAAANEGANIAIADISNSKNKYAMNDILKINAKAIFLECDVSIFTHVEVAMQKTIDAFGSIDVALNNAGIAGVANKIANMSEHDWLKVIGVNLSGVFNCMHHELKQMAKQKSGSIINMSSILGKVGFNSSAHYVAAKHGVIGLTQTAAIEYATEGIRINAICPGFIDTPLLNDGGINHAHEEQLQYIINLHPIKRLGHAEEIAKGFIFLASEDASFVNGTALEIDGAYLAQ